MMKVILRQSDKAPTKKAEIESVAIECGGCIFYIAPNDNGIDIGVSKGDIVATHESRDIINVTQNLF